MVVRKFIHKEIIQLRIMNHRKIWHTRKQIPLLLNVGTSRCTRTPTQADGICTHLSHGHTCFYFVRY